MSGWERMDRMAARIAAGVRGGTLEAGDALSVRERWPRSIVVVTLLLAALVASGPPLAAADPDPWPADRLLRAADLAAWIAASRPVTVVYVGPPALYRPGHIPGATMHGPASEAKGLADLRRWAAGVPKDATLVIYCGCCPLDHCPNVRPAYAALRDMGFTGVHVLHLPDNFETDWVKKGYPIATD